MTKTSKYWDHVAANADYWKDVHAKHWLDVLDQAAMRLAVLPTLRKDSESFKVNADDVQHNLDRARAGLKALLDG